MKKWHSKKGLTLVELLVVIGIVSVMAAIAIPTFIRYSGLTSGDLYNAAQDVQQMLRAAQIYAGTYNVDTAVTYSIREFNDSVSGEDITVLEGMALVRRMTDEELATIPESADCPDEFPIFTPVRDPRGAFQTFPGQICIAYILPTGGADITYAGATYEPKLLFDVNMPENTLPANHPTDDMGLESIRVGTVEDGLAAPRTGTGFGEGPCRTDGFPAHIFKSTGEMITESPKQRFELNVTGVPNLPDQDRFVEVTADGNLPIARTVQLFATLGRVELLN